MKPQQPGPDKGNQRMAPGDQAPPGTPGTGNNICRDCRGSGRLDDRPCPTCSGTGYVVEGIGGA